MAFKLQLLIVATIMNPMNSKSFLGSGFNFVNGAWSEPKYDTQESYNEIYNIYKQTASNCWQLTFAWYQHTINDTFIYRNNATTPSDEQLLTVTLHITTSYGCVIWRPTIVIVNTNNGQDSHRDIGKYFNTNQEWDLWF